MKRRSNWKDLTGQRFGKLVCIRYLAGYWDCRCDCGRNHLTRTGALLGGDCKTCGICYRPPGFFKHGLHRSPEYSIWKAMKQRCSKPSHERYVDYGARGIRVCDRWIKSFKDFISDVGRRPSPQHQLDRINNEGNYEPSNVRWATKDQQYANKRSNIFLEYDKQKLTLKQWGDKLGIKPHTLHTRFRSGWTTEQILTTGVGEPKSPPA